MNSSIRVAIIGSTGYGGVELIRLTHRHPKMLLTSVHSSSSAGQPMTASYPHLTEIIADDLQSIDTNELKKNVDLVFLATPSGVSAGLAPEIVDSGLKVVDLSGDFRLRSPDLYKEWYRRTPAEEPYLQQAVYGLTEIYEQRIKDAAFISNPGCYPTATLLALIPVLKEGWIDRKSLIVDAKSGVSGAGRGLNLPHHFSEMNENFLAYKVNRHQHTPEIEQVLGDIAGEAVTITFTPHLVPMTRGILSTIYAPLTKNVNEHDLIVMYREFYRNRPFVRIRNEGTWPATKEVWGSNYCDIGFAVDERTNRLTIVSVIDNVVKGAAGQAVQNVNVMMGWDETLGLDFVPVYP